MRVDWQQELEGFSLLQIRDVLRALPYTDTPFDAPFVAGRLGTAEAPAKRLVDGLLFNRLIRPDPESRGSFLLTDTGISLRAAQARKRFKRDRADKAIAKLLAAVDQTNAQPTFMHDVTWVAVFGSYITDAADLGDIDVAVELKARWTIKRVGEPSDREARQERFVAAFPPPASVNQSFVDRLFWPENYLRRQLRVDRDMKIIDRSALDAMGCAHRIIYPEKIEIPAKAGWICEREEIVLRTPTQASV